MTQYLAGFSVNYYMHVWLKVVFGSRDFSNRVDLYKLTIILNIKIYRNVEDFKLIPKQISISPQNGFKSYVHY